MGVDPVSPQLQPLQCEQCGVFGLDGDMVDGPEEEIEQIKTKRIPRLPTAQEIEEHEKTHLPYRRWCSTCVASRLRDDGHPARDLDEAEVDEVHFDYCFLRNVRGEDYAVVLVSKDRGTKVTNAHVVPNKGASFGWVVKQSIRDLEKMGYYNAGSPSLFKTT